MAKTVQFHVIQGRLVKDPTLKTTKNGKAAFGVPAGIPQSRQN